MPRKKLRNVTVTITCKKDGCTIHPSVVVVHPGQTIVFKKAAKDTVHIQISRMGRAFRIKKEEKTRPFTVPKGTRLGLYPYAAFCYDKRQFCTGSSMPIIIVPKDPIGGIS